MGVGLGTSMGSGVSGLLANSTKMGTIGNNLANVNTYGFKGARTDFMDLMSANVGTAAGVKQIGRGVRVGTVVSDYSQGGLETTSENLDMAISGNGFFMVKQKSQVGSNGKMLNTGNTTTYFSRAGDFSFDSDGYLVSPGQSVRLRNPPRRSKATASHLAARVPTGVSTARVSASPASSASVQ